MLTRNRQVEGSKQTPDYRTLGIANDKSVNDDTTFLDNSERNDLLENDSGAGEEIDFDQYGSAIELGKLPDDGQRRSSKKKTLNQFMNQPSFMIGGPS